MWWFWLEVKIKFCVCRKARKQSSLEYIWPLAAHRLGGDGLVHVLLGTPPKQLTHRLHRAAVPDEVRTDSRAREASGVLRAASCRGSGDGVRPAAWTAAAQLLWLGDPGRETALKRRAGEGGRCPGSPAPTLASSTHALYAVGKPSRAPIDFLLHPVLLNSLWLK